MGSSDHDSQKIPAMMMYEIKMTILGRVEPRGAGMSNFLVGASLCFGHKLPPPPWDRVEFYQKLVGTPRPYLNVQAALT